MTALQVRMLTYKADSKLTAQAPGDPQQASGALREGGGAGED